MKSAAENDDQARSPAAERLRRREEMGATIIMDAAYKGAAGFRQLAPMDKGRQRTLCGKCAICPRFPLDLSTMTSSVWDTIPGGQSLIEWFGRVPRFHDAEVLDISIAAKTPSFVRIHTWIMIDKVDDRGYFVTERHAVVTVSLDEVTYIALYDFNLPGIIFDLELSRFEDGFQILWSGSYGVAGTLRAKRIRLDFAPGKPKSP